MLSTIVDERQSLFLVEENNLPDHPTVNPSVAVFVPEAAAVVDAEVVVVPEVRVKRAYNKKDKTVTLPAPVKQSKRLQKQAIPVAITITKSPKIWILFYFI